MDELTADQNLRLAAALLEKTGEAAALGLRVKELEAELATYKRGDRHIIELRDDGFTIQHPLSCRPNLFDCIVNFAAREHEEFGQHPNGRFYCTYDGDQLMLEEEAG